MAPNNFNEAAIPPAAAAAQCGSNEATDPAIPAHEQLVVGDGGHSALRLTRSPSLSESETSTLRNPTSLSQIFTATATSLFTPERPVGKAPSVGRSLRNLLLQRENILLICIPTTFVLRFATETTSTTTSTLFASAFLGLLPTARIFKVAMEDLTLRVSPHAGTFIRVFTGNIIELISGVIALRQCQLEVLQASIVGSILINILLVLGVACILGGIKFAGQGYSTNHAHRTSHMLMLGTFATLLFSYFFIFFKLSVLCTNWVRTDIFILASLFGKSDIEETKISNLRISRGGAVLLLFCYFHFGVYQLYTHAFTFEDSSHSTGYPLQDFHHENRHSAGQRAIPDLESGAEVEKESEPLMSIILLLVASLGACTLIYMLSDFLVSALSDITAHTPLKEGWVGLILIPLAGTFSRRDVFEAAAYSMKNKLNSSLALSLGSSVNISLFIQPLLILLAWMMNKNLTLLYDPFETLALFLSVLFVNFTLLPGQSDWLSGFSLIAIYTLIAMSFWFYTSPRAFSSLILAC
ncbi:Sodium/calcium exchanger protein-domain-containing protein [Mycena venus]|uniref:Sodium/calcium exchanger protein-domain-containing protein n=1 Tax=Mycena venus TaxID=2733690 RepID=A0A8H6YDC1_9AGAR|nr:Sodium/calcium exchanger protein-domain-containing protein [Mycena venus]